MIRSEQIITTLARAVYLLKCMAVSAMVTLTLMMMAAPWAHAEIMADIWVTKYALTRGIEHKQAVLEGNGALAIAGDTWYSRDEFQLDKQSAVERAEVMRRKEIESLKRRRGKLEAMRFE